MWKNEVRIETSATPARVWRLLSDVQTWKDWNSGIESIQIRGPFAKGTTFEMKPPGVDAFMGTLIDVREQESFTDETVVDGTRVVVTHKLVPRADGGTEIVYLTQVSGRTPEGFGRMVTADFPEVLKALKQRAESAGC